MFMIMPKARAGDAQAHGAAEPRARVKVACDRCRMKKIKCDGSLPCLRCMQDSVICLVSKKPATDAAAATREYINSLETQQARLVRALSRLQARCEQPLNDREMEDIRDALKVYGYSSSDIQGAEDHVSSLDRQTRASLGQCSGPQPGSQLEPQRKRKRVREQAHTTDGLNVDNGAPNGSSSEPLRLPEIHHATTPAHGPSGPAADLFDETAAQNQHQDTILTFSPNSRQTLEQQNPDIAPALLQSFDNPHVEIGFSMAQWPQTTGVQPPSDSIFQGTLLDSWEELMDWPSTPSASLKSDTKVFYDPSIGQ